MLSGAAVAILTAVGASLPGLRGDLTEARDALTSAQDAVGDGDLPAARRHVDVAARASSSARTTTHRPWWDLAVHLPVLRPSARETRAVAEAVDRATSDVLRPLVEVDARQSRWDGRVDPAPLVAAREPLTRAERALGEVRTALASAPRSGVGVVADARSGLEDRLDRLARTLTELGVAARTVPELIGSTRPQRFFVGFQNTAEQRATGGLLGAYGVLRLDKGRFELERIGPNQELLDRPSPVLDLGADHTSRYGPFASTSSWRSSNLTPDVPTVGRSLVALWEDQTGQRLDGALLLDPVALSMLLEATGPVTLPDGTRVTASNAVDLLLSGVYRRFTREQDAARNRFLQETGRLAFGALGRRGLDARAVLRQVSRAAGTGHLQVWSADPRVQRDLARSRVAGALPQDGPYLAVVTQDAGGSKLGYYLRRKVSYVAAPTGEAVELGTGPRFEEAAVLTVSLTNAAPRRGLPPYVTLRADDPSAPAGQSRTWVSIYLGPEATLLSATVDGAPVGLASDVERGLTVLSTYVSTDPGRTSTIELRLRQPALASDTLRYRQQPLLRDDDLVVERRGSRRPVELVYEPLRG